MAATSIHRSNTRNGCKAKRNGREAHHCRCNVRNSFLNATFASIPGNEIPNDEAVIVLGNGDIERLRGDVAKFFKAYGISAALPEIVGNDKTDLLNLYNLLKNNLPDKDWNIEVIHKDGTDKSPIKFMVYSYVKFPEYTVWGMPVKKMAEVDDKTRKLLALTFAVMYRKDMYDLPEDNFDFQYCLGQVENQFEKDENGNTKFDDDAEMWSEDYRDMAVRYLNGDISQLFGEIMQAKELETEYGKPIDCILEETIKLYREEKYHNPQLLDIIEQVLEICREDWLSEYHMAILKQEYGGDFGSEDDSDTEFMDFTRIFFFCYDIEDCITEAAIECFNQEAYNYGVGELYCHSFIDDDNIKERMESCFPERWVDANTKLIDELQR